MRTAELTECNRDGKNIVFNHVTSSQCRLFTECNVLFFDYVSEGPDDPLDLRSEYFALGKPIWHVSVDQSFRRLLDRTVELVVVVKATDAYKTIVIFSEEANYQFLARVNSLRMNIPTRGSPSWDSSRVVVASADGMIQAGQPEAQSFVPFVITVEMVGVYVVVVECHCYCTISHVPFKVSKHIQDW